MKKLMYKVVKFSKKTKSPFIYSLFEDKEDALAFKKMLEDSQGDYEVILNRWTWEVKIEEPI